MRSLACVASVMLMACGTGSPPVHGAGGSSDAGAEGSAGHDGGAPDAAACPGDGGIPDDLSCTGLYADWASKTLAPDVVAYTPGLVFWSDGAEKARFLYLPPGAQIDTSDMDNWVFPAGTKVWKSFTVGGALLETRLIWKVDAADWVYLDYRWSPDGTRAVRLDSGEKNVNGSSYEIPATSVCGQCHGGRPDVVLGLDWIGLGVSGAQGVTLAMLQAANRLTVAPPSVDVRIPEDATGKAAAALGWLHVNCGSACHNANYGAGAMGTGLFTKLLASQLYGPDGSVASVVSLDSYVTTVGRSANAMPGGAAVARIDPGHAAASLVSIYAGTRCPDSDAGCIQMPPIVSHVPDDAGLGLVDDWIDALGDGGAD